jgi:pimeloyl-ACP methyl ester carboxylesterase
MLPKLQSRAHVLTSLLLALVLAAAPGLSAAAASAFAAAPVPTVSGTAVVGSTLTANPGTWNPVPAFTYQWKRGSTVISGATSSTYKPVTADVGATLTVTVTGTKTGYVTTSRTSAPSAAITAAIRTIHLSPGPIAQNTTWSKTDVDVVVVDDGYVRVPKGTTLTIDAGVVVKFAGIGSRGIEVNGTLQVRGETDAPVIMTIISDDTVAGDTNGDGRSTDPADGIPWSLVAQQGANMNLAFLDQRFGQGMIHFTAPGSDATVITDSHFTGFVQWGPVNYQQSWPSGYKPSLRFLRNTIEDGALSITSGSVDSDFEIRNNVFVCPRVSCDLYMQIDSRSIHPSKITGNSTSASPGDIRLNGTLRENWVVTSQDGFQWGVSGQLFIPTGIEFALHGGSKFGLYGLIYVDGKMSVTGNSQQPVFLGNLDGTTSPYGQINLRQGGSFIASYMTLAAAISGTSILSARGYQFDAQISDSTIYGNVNLNRVASISGKIVIDRNAVIGGTIRVQNHYLAEDTASVRSNSVDYSGPEPAYDIDVGTITPESILDNRAVRASLFKLGGTLRSDWTLPFLQNMDWSPGVTVTNSKLTVPGGMTLRDGGLSSWDAGSIAANASEQSEIVFENVSLNSNSEKTVEARNVVFRTTGDSSSAVVTGDRGTLLLDEVSFEGLGGPDSRACVTVYGTLIGHVHGDLSGCYTGVASYSKILNSFDATEVWWGTSDGPQPFGSGARVDGNIDVVPWVGWVAPTSPTPARFESAGKQCVQNLVIAVRGSGEAPVGPVDVATDRTLYDRFSYSEMTAPGAYEFRGLGDRVQAILTGQMRSLSAEGERIPGTTTDYDVGLLDYLDGIEGYDANESSRTIALLYPAASTDLITTNLSPQNFTTYLASMSWGLGWLLDEIREQADACPDQKIALVGYSQGALVIQAALVEMNATFSEETRSHVNAVLLLANPIQNPQADGYEMLGSMTDHPDANSEGYVEKLVRTPAIASLIKWLYDNDDMDTLIDALGAPFPGEFAGKTKSYCNYGDQMCAPQDGMNDDLMSDIHGAYTPQELAGFGRASAMLLID